jgi:hypothetical protein
MRAWISASATFGHLNEIGDKKSFMPIFFEYFDLDRIALGGADPSGTPPSISTTLPHIAGWPIGLFNQ